jgi:hypothetical protein
MKQKKVKRVCKEICLACAKIKKCEVYGREVINAGI